MILGSLAMSSDAIYVVNTYEKGVGPDRVWEKHGSLADAINNFAVPSQKRYADRCGVDYVELKDEGNAIRNKYHAACLRSITMFKDFADSPYDRILFLDCDILIRKNAKNIFKEIFHFAAGGIGADKANAHQDLVLKSSLNVRVPSGYFFCTGVAMYPRKVFEAYANAVSEDLLDAQIKTKGFFDMHGCGYLNYKTRQIPDQLSHVWHSMPPGKPDTAFVHFGGDYKVDLINIANNSREDWE
jgi:hypothetical protein